MSSKGSDRQRLPKDNKIPAPWARIGVLDGPERTTGPRSELGIMVVSINKKAWITQGNQAELRERRLNPGKKRVDLKRRKGRFVTAKATTSQQSTLNIQVSKSGMASDQWGWVRQNPISLDSENDDLILDHAQRGPGVQSGEQGLEEPHARKELEREPPGGGSRPLLAASSCKS